MDALILGEIPEQAATAAAIAAPVLVSPATAQLLCVALLVLLAIVVADVFFPTKGSRR